MCIFANPVKTVSNTRIAVFPLSYGRQLTVYTNSVAISKRGKGNAMILPFPRRQGASVELVDFSKYPGDFWRDCDSLFPEYNVYAASGGFSFGSVQGSAPKTLPVQRIGGYNCSIAESIEDLKRINSNVFEISHEAGEILSKHYAKGYSFVIAQFDHDVSGHPLGVISARMDNDMLYIPTRHEHGEPSNDWSGQIQDGGQFFGVQQAVVHENVQCDECKRSPFIGYRFKCLSCPDYDLCTGCYAQRKHPQDHVFAHIVVPVKLDPTNANLLMHRPLVEKHVFYPNGLPAAPEQDPEFDHTIYVFNGILSAYETNTDQRKVDKQQLTHIQLKYVMEHPPTFQGVQRIRIRGKRPNKDYQATVIEG